MLDTEQIGGLYRTYFNQLRRVAVVLLRDEDESRDAVNDVFARLMETDPHVDNMEAYLLTAVRNRCLDLISQKQTAERARRQLTTETAPDLTPAAQHEQTLTSIRTFVDEELTAQTRRVVRLRFYERKQYREIADELDISEAAVYKHLSQALRKLKQRFNP